MESSARIKVCHVFSEVDQSHLIKSFGEVMDKNKYEISFVFMGKKKPQLFDFFKERGYPVEFFEFSGKPHLPLAIWKLIRIFKRMRPHIVHTHLIEGSLAGLTAAKIAGIEKRIHTRHMGNENHIYYPHGVYYDKANNFLSKRIVAISNVVANVLIECEGVNSQKVVTIPHGFHLENLNPDEQRKKQLKEKYGLNGYYPVVGSISRFIHWKGVHNTILAFAELLKTYPRAKLVLVNAVGPESPTLYRSLRENIPTGNYVTIEFEPDIFSLYAAFDVFIHVPVNKNVEAFGMVYVEPLKIGIPSVFTLSGIACEFIEDKKNALVVPYNCPESITGALKLILQDERLRERIVTGGKEDVWKLFHTRRMASQLDSLYTDLYSSHLN